MSENEPSVADFVSETLRQIAEGVNRAQGQHDGSAVLTVPRYVIDDGKGNTKDWYSNRMVHVVSFDLAVEATSGKQTAGKGGAGLRLHVVSLGAEKHAASAESTTAMQRVRFEVPVLWPSHDGSPSEEAHREARAEFQSEQQAQFESLKKSMRRSR